MSIEARSMWASETIRMQNLQPSKMIGSDSSLHAYPILKYCKLRLNCPDGSGSSSQDNLRISRTVPRTQVPQHNFSFEQPILEKILAFENQDKVIADNRIKLQNFKKLCEEQQRTLKGVREMQKQKRLKEEEMKIVEEKKVDSNDKAAKIANFANVTGEKDREKIRSILSENDWDLQRAMSFHFSSFERKPAPAAGSVQISIYIDNKRHEWTYKSNETLWELYTMVARMGKNESFHFVDSKGRKYKEHMFDKTFDEVGWVPSVTLTVCKDDPKPKPALLDI